MAPLGDEGRRHPGDTRLDREPFGLELGLEKSGALVLLVSHLGQVPDLQGYLAQTLVPSVDEIDDGWAILGPCRVDPDNPAGEQRDEEDARTVLPRHGVLPGERNQQDADRVNP